jgi:diacylglycerol kinase (ATP)
LQRILQATLNTLNGLRAAASSEAAFRQELIALAIAVPLALVIATDLWMRVALIGVVVAIMIVELLNTAIEKLADRVTLDHDPVIGRVKDMGSAAVGLTLLLAGLVWLIALWERIAALLA